MKEKNVKLVKVGVHIQKWEDEEIFLPAFQSGDRWDDKRRVSYCQSLLAGIPTPPMYLGENGELIEGQQRTKALKKALDHELGFNNFQLENLKNCKIRIITLCDYTEEELSNFYIAINNGGVAHNKLEISKAKLTSDDAEGFALLEAHPIWDKLPVKEGRQRRLAVSLQALSIMMSESGAADIGSAAQNKLLLDIQKNPREYIKPLTLLRDSIDYVDRAILHKQKWMKRGMIPFIFVLASEAFLEQDEPAKFGGFCQQFFLGRFTVKTSQKRNASTLPSNEYWSKLASGSGTSKPAAVKVRWDLLFSSYSEFIFKTPVYEEPVWVKEKKEREKKKKEKEQDQKLFDEFLAWKQAQGLLEKKSTPEWVQNRMKKSGGVVKINPDGSKELIPQKELKPN